MEATLLLLAGGLSRRMGEPKSLLEVDGKSLLRWQLDRLAPSFAGALVSVAGSHTPVPRDLPEGIRLVHDLHRERGPLAGIEAGLAAAGTDAVFALAVDLPHAPAELAQRLLDASAGHDAAVPVLEGRPEPVAAVYRQSAAAEISVALAQGRLAVRDALAELDAAYVEGLDARWFANLNTPEDFRRFLAAMR